MLKKSSSLSSLALQKFKRNFWGVLSLGYIFICGIIAVFAYQFAPDNSQNANQMHLSIHSRSPGFCTKILTIPSESKKQSFLNKLFFGNKTRGSEIPISNYRVEKNELYVTPYSDTKEKLLEKKISKKTFNSDYNWNEITKKYITSKTFYLGTDKYGRDLLSRILIGTRISFFIGFIAVFISLVIGIIMGALAGYYGGKIDAIIMWVINISWSIPTLLLVIAITLALGKGFWQVFIAVGLTMWVEVARVVRGQVLGVKKMQYVTAAKALGFTDLRIIFKHILPNILAPVIVISAANFAGAILIESGLSFLGIGAQPPTPSWGAMIKDHYSYIILGKPYLAIIPGIGIMSLVMSFMLIGNALRDALDVKN
jgi:peptide/nickel transport system permease protein